MLASVLSVKDILQMQTLFMPKPFLGIQRGWAQEILPLELVLSAEMEEGVDIRHTHMLCPHVFPSTCCSVFTDMYTTFHTILLQMLTRKQC